MYNEISKTKIMAILIGVSIMILAFLLIPMKARTLEVAIVNPDNGDIAFAYVYSNGITVRWYDNTGKELLYKSKRGGFYVNLMFKDNCLYVIQGQVGTYAFSRDGLPCEPMTKEEMNLQAKEEWSGWASSRGRKEYVLGDYRYRYEYAPYPKSLFEYDCYVYIDNITEGTSTCIAHLKNHS